MNNLKRHLPTVIVLVIIAALAGISYFKNRGANTNKTGQEQTQNQPGDNTNNNPNQQNPPAAGEGELVGTLKTSDNLKRGNLMLVISDHTIYLFTSRNYSALLNKQVTMKINGTMENFSEAEVRSIVCTILSSPEFLISMGVCNLIPYATR